MQDEKKDAYATAIRCLARREYGARELALILQKKGFSSSTIQSLIENLQNDGSLSDERFAESFIRARIARGFGPTRIGMELRQKGVPEHIVETHLCEVEGWDEQIARVREKKFGTQDPGTPQEKAKQWRYLQYKGFTSEQIASLYKE